MRAAGWRMSNHVQQLGVQPCCLVLLVEFHLAVIVIGVASASVVGTVPPFTRRHFFFLYPQHFLHKGVEYFITGLQDRRRQTDEFRRNAAVPSEHALTLALTSHCRNLHFCLILFGPPNFFMSLQKSHWAQSSVLLQGSHSPHILTDLFT